MPQTFIKQELVERFIEEWKEARKLCKSSKLVPVEALVSGF